MGKKLTTEIFIERAKLIYEERYLYDQVKYINSKTKVEIICPLHGSFFILVNNYLNGHSCPKCGIEKAANSKRSNSIKFIQMAKKLHGNRYDYSKIEYKSNHSKVEIICPIHGLFLQKPSSHLRKLGCPKCGIEKASNSKKLNIIDVIIRAKKVHGNRYDYSNVNYVGAKTKIEIICPVHGSFFQFLFIHLNKSGCPKCANENAGNYKKLNTNEFIQMAKKLHGDSRYDYSKIEYKNSKIKVEIICPIHGSFFQTPNGHLQNKGCAICANNVKSNNDDFIYKSEFIHGGNKYSYEKINYINAFKKVEMVCKKHGSFFQTPNNNLCGEGCPKCMGSISKVEKELLDFIKENCDGKIIENNKIEIKPYELDIYLPELKLAIEFNGLYWHSEEYKPNNYHLNKTKLCKEKGIHLIQIFEDQWQFKKDIVKSRILNLLGKNEEKIYGRKCVIEEVNNSITRAFLIENHIQGSVNSKVNLGLYYDNILVSLMTFGKLRLILGQKHKEGHYELLRFCNKKNTSVVGSANKLFKYFIKNYKYKEIISYADRFWTTESNNVYKTLKFELERITKPNYFYIVKKNRKNRFNYRKDVLVKNGYDKDKSEHGIMLERKIYRIYNSGQLKYKFLNLN